MDEKRVIFPSLDELGLKLNSDPNEFNAIKSVQQAIKEHRGSYEYTGLSPLNEEPSFISDDTKEEIMRKLERQEARAIIGLFVEVVGSRCPTPGYLNEKDLSRVQIIYEYISHELNDPKKPALLTDLVDVNSLEWLLQIAENNLKVTKEFKWLNEYIESRNRTAVDAAIAINMEAIAGVL